MMQKSKDILQEIIDHKKQEISVKKTKIDLLEQKGKISHLANTKNFTQAIVNQIKTGKPAIIAEIKKSSPSKGIIRENFNPIEIAKSYEKHGATCLSILTDHKFFQGRDLDLIEVKKNTTLPVLRKDFLIDEYQIYESRYLGADCILLIAAVLNDNDLAKFTDLAQELNLSVVVEIHDALELERALKLNTPLIGINNRNLRTFKTDLQTTINLIKNIPDNKIIITESGIHTKKDVEKMRENNVHTFLIGETLMRADDPGEKLQELFEY